MRANIYSLDTWKPQQREAVHDGIHMVATNIGEDVVIAEKRIQLPGRYINPDSIGFNKFDKLTELHVIMAPFSREDDSMGLAYLGTGCAIVREDISKAELRHTTAHEVSHALGFVSLKASRGRKNDSRHCSCPECVMFPMMHSKETQFFKRKSTGQNDFCGDCKVDMFRHGAENLRTLRVDRMADGQLVRPARTSSK